MYKQVDTTNRKKSETKITSTELDIIYYKY